MLAVQNGHFELAIALVDAGADPNDVRTGFTPLHMIAVGAKAGFERHQRWRAGGRGGAPHEPRFRARNREARREREFSPAQGAPKQPEHILTIGV